MALIETFKDSFGDTTRGNGWNLTSSGSGAASIAEASGHLAITIRTGTAGVNYSGYITANSYDLTGSAVYGRLDLTNWPGQDNENVNFTVQVSADDYLQFYATYVTDANDLFYRVRVGATNVATAAVDYSATDHAWWRIREAAGTIYFDTGTDNAGTPDTWTNRWTYATASFTAGITAMYIAIDAGSWSSVSNADSVEFEAINCTTTDASATGDVGTTVAAAGAGTAAVTVAARRAATVAAVVGTTTVAATVTGQTPATSVEYYLESSENNIDWAAVGTWQSARSESWNSRLVANGTAYLRVKARDAANPADVTGYGTLTLTVDNPIVSGARTSIKTHRSPGRSTSRSRY